ncbi:glycosyltransferase family 2 protein [Clostridiisalibacter paucivorans]|uniref:glycosyltransferase family 2 protein n=1 Tax=Clostridiisalibacter paucivorans TaxID=408753 RepID=UPI00047BAA14|nr:glycosyltransferase family 2 protein [Clostridiisalibacter paucivorans]
MEKNNIIALIPVFNEEKTIRNTILGIINLKIIDRILVIDDGSTDNTIEKIKDLNVKIIKLKKNMGKGYAIKKGLESLYNINFSYLVLLDGDLSNTSKEILKLLKPVLDKKADVSIAKITANKKGGLGLVKSLAKYGTYFYTKCTLESVLSGQRVYKKEVINNIHYIPNGYGVETAMTIDILNSGHSIIEVPVNMKHRETGRDLKGFMHRGKQFISILYTLIIIFIRRCNNAYI